MTDNHNHSTVRRTTAVLVCLLMVLGLWSWVESRSLASNRSSYGTLVTQLEQMSGDVQRITALRSAPRLAAERERANDELLAQVRSAMSAAQMAEACWIGNDPAQPVRVPRSPYKRLGTRLSFEEVSMRQLVSFGYHLIDSDATVSISNLRLSTPRKPEPDKWNAEVVVSYLIYSPYQKAAPKRRSRAGVDSLAEGRGGRQSRVWRHRLGPHLPRNWGPYKRIKSASDTFGAA